jgi:hypothetical protein
LVPFSTGLSADNRQCLQVWVHLLKCECKLSNLATLEEIFVTNTVLRQIRGRVRIVEGLSYTRVSVPSSELGPPTPSLAKLVSFPLELKRGREQHSRAGEGGGGPNSDDWTEILVPVYSVVRILEAKNCRQGA